MNFQSPLMLLGLLAVAAPIVIHLINRQRAARVHFPALEFLLASKRKLARRLKLKQLALLAMRISFFILLPLAMARPSMFCGGEQTQSADARLPASVVLLVDDSGSMSAPGDGGTLYTEAVARARDTVRGLRSWDQVALVFTSGASEVAVGEFTDDRGAVLDALEAHVPRFGASDVRAALVAAREIQETSRQPRRRTVFITDHSGGGWPDTVDDVPSTGIGQLEIEALGTQPAVGEVPTNVAVSALTFERGESGGAGEYVFLANVRTWGGAARDVTATLTIDGESVGAAVVEAVPGEEVSTSFVHRLEGPGPFVVSVELDGDTGQSVDDTRTLSLQPDRAVRTLLINGDARSVSLNDEVFFLQRALELSLAEQREIETAVTSPEEFVSVDLAGFDVIVMANVAALPVPQVSRIQAFVESGGGLLMSAGDNVDPDRWNSLFAPLLPKPIRSVKVLATRGHSDANIQATRVGEIDVLHPAVRVFGQRGGESIRSALVYRYVLLEPSTEQQAEVLASFADGGPALLERALGRGRVMLWTSTFDDAWTDLPLATTYLPLVRRLVQYLARRGGGAESQAELGERVAIPIGGLRPERVVVETPDGARRVLPTEGDEAGFVPGAPGVYRVSVTVNGEDLRAPELDFAANAHHAESEMTRLEGALVTALEERSEADAATTSEGQQAQGRTLWPMLLFLALCALYAETLLAVRRRLWVRLGTWVGYRRGSTGL